MTIKKAEDWQSEKCEISLLEGMNVDFVIQQLDEALDWVRQSSLSATQIDALSDRLLLRKVSQSLTCLVA